MAAAAESSVSHDEVRGHPVAAQITGSLSVIDPDGEILVNFEMKMGRVHAVVVADVADLLSPSDLFSFSYSDLVEMGVE